MALHSMVGSCSRGDRQFRYVLFPFARVNIALLSHYALVNNTKQLFQGEIEEVLTRRFHRRIPVVGAGRTDAGVHARGQAIHFDLFHDEIPFKPPTPPEIVDTDASFGEGEEEQCTKFCNELQHSMNRMMPLDIRMFHLQLAPYTWAPMLDIDDEGSEGDGYDVDADEVDPEYDDDNETHQQIALQRARPWHAIQRAQSKWYSYRLTLGPTLWNPMERFTRTHFVHRPSFATGSSSSSSRPSQTANDEPYAITKVDIERLESILQLYVGTHDFGAFGGQLEQNAKKRNDGKRINTVRTVYRVELVKEPLKNDYTFGAEGGDAETLSQIQQEQLGFIGEEGNYRIDFLLKGALYKMVRNMVGTAMEVWLGRMKEEQLAELLKIPESEKGGDDNDLLKMPSRKDNPSKPAPPEGLTLECVYYEDGF